MTDGHRPCPGLAGSRTAKRIVACAAFELFALVIAARRLPAPESLVLVTSNRSTVVHGDSIAPRSGSEPAVRRGLPIASTAVSPPITAIVPESTAGELDFSP